MGLSITLIIIIVTCLISYQAFNNYSMKEQLLMHPYSVKHDGDYIRMLTSGFVHADFVHLGVNMYVLYIFGEFVELKFSSVFGDLMGRIIYLVFYLASIVVASLPSLMKHQNNPTYRALGASGGTSAIIFAFTFFLPWSTLLLFFVIPMPAIVLAVLYLFYSSYMAKKGTDNIGHDAHFGGAVFGFLFMVVISLLFAPDWLNQFIYELSNPRF